MSELEIGFIVLVVALIVSVGMWMVDHSRLMGLLAEKRVAYDEEKLKRKADDYRFRCALVELLDKEMAVKVIAHYKFDGDLSDANMKKAEGVYRMTKMKMDMEFANLFGQRNINI